MNNATATSEDGDDEVEQIEVSQLPSNISLTQEQCQRLMSIFQQTQLGNAVHRLLVPHQSIQ